MAWQGRSTVYNPSSVKPYKISRSKIDLFIECPRCFYLDRRLGVTRPGMPAFSLNSAVDHLLKKEFDLLRISGQPHELMQKYHVDAVPYTHPDLEVWRENFVGKQVLHEGTNLLVFGAIDDIWVKKNGELIIVDYKSTSTEKEITLDGLWKEAYKRQLEIYQWIFRTSGFSVSDVAYIVYANAGKNRTMFDGRLEFTLTLHAYTGDPSWVEPALYSIKETLQLPSAPPSTRICQFCQYRKKASEHEVYSGQLML